MAKLQTSKSAAMLRSMSMGHHGKALLQKLDVNKLTTKERVFPSLDATAGNSYNHYAGHTKSMTDAEKQKLLRSKKLKKIVRSAVGNEFNDLKRLMADNQKSTETTSSMLDSLSHVVKSLRHRAREALAEEDIDFMEGSRTRNLNLKTKTLERAKRLAKKLPKDLKENLRKVVELHKSSSMDSSMFRNTKKYNTANKAEIAPQSNYGFGNEDLNASFLELPRLSLSRVGYHENFGRMQSRDRGRTPSVYGRLLDEDKFTGVYKERFNDFHRDYFDTHRMGFRPSFSRMVNNRHIHKEKQQTSRGRFKQNLRPNAYHKISGCTF